MNIKIRTTILEKSLLLENFINESIVILIGVNNKDPKTIGNKSSSIPLSSKINLLYDLEAMDKATYNLLFCFIEIRNQFMHNIGADSYLKVIELISKKALFLKQDIEAKKRFESSNSDKEKEYFLSIIAGKLIYNVLDASQKLGKYCLQKFEERVELTVKEELQTKHIEMILNVEKIYRESVKDIITTYSRSLKKIDSNEPNIGDVLLDAINRLSIKRIKEQLPDLYEFTVNRKNDH